MKDQNSDKKNYKILNIPNELNTYHETWSVKLSRTNYYLLSTYRDES